MPRSPRRPYSKPPLSEDQLLNRCIERGLNIPDRDRAARYLRHIGYYRLSPYMLPFQVGSSTHMFKPGTKFDDVLNLYVFDRELRLLATDALERIEVAVRAATSNTMSMQADGKAFWYLERSNVQDEKTFTRTIDALCEEVRRQKKISSREESGDHLHYPDALSHYVATYDHPETPPSWLAVELLTLGNLHHLYASLPAAYRKQIAQQLGLQDPVLGSWLHSYVRVRNVCAHHGRLWNRFLGVYPAIPRSPSIPWLKNKDTFRTDDPNALPRKRLYPVLVSFQTVLFTISPHSHWASRLRDLLLRYPAVSREAIGMPPQWDDDPFWQRAFASAEEDHAHQHRRR